jgi:hypothetical protein
MTLESLESWFGSGSSIIICIELLLMDDQKIMIVSSILWMYTSNLCYSANESRNYELELYKIMKGKGAD